MTEELPEPWRSVLDPKGVRTRRGLATKAGIAPQTAVRLVNGQGVPRPDTIQAVAKAFFGGDRNVVRQLAGMSGMDYGDFDLPPEASLLRPDQREAVRAVIAAMLPPAKAEQQETPGRMPGVGLRRVAMRRDPG